MTIQYRYYHLIIGAFLTVLLCSNLIGPSKIVQVDLPLLGKQNFGPGILFFPFTYIFGDILTEVYGYALARRAIWTGFAAMLLATFITWIVLTLPPSPDEPNNAKLQPALEVCFNNGWRVTLGSILAFCVGDFVNSYVLAKMKVRMGGRRPWMRFIASTVVGQGMDTLIFYPIAFYGIWETHNLLRVMPNEWLLKIFLEIVMLPLTTIVCAKLKSAEGVDTFDTHTDFNPFSLKH